MVPDEEITTTLNRPGRLYLADVHVFGGNSGAPLFARIYDAPAYFLLGIVSGYIYETQDFQLEVATTMTGKANANSGISTIVPVDELRALLDSAELQRLRDEHVARERKPK